MSSNPIAVTEASLFAMKLIETKTNDEKLKHLSYKWTLFLSFSGLIYSIFEFSVVGTAIAFFCLLAPLIYTKSTKTNFHFKFCFMSTLSLSLIHVVFPALNTSQTLFTMMLSQITLLINAAPCAVSNILALLPAVAHSLHSLFLRAESIGVSASHIETHGWVFPWKSVFPISYLLLLVILTDYKNALFEKHHEEAEKTQRTLQELQELRELQAKHEQLQKICDARAKKINLLEQELQKSIASRDSVASSLSHELRNPLNVILGNLDLLIMEVKEPKSLEMLESSRDSCEMLLSLVNNVLDANKIHTGQLELNPQPIQVLPMIQNLWSSTSVCIAKKGLTGQVSMDRKLPRMLEIDKHRVTQICFNIISNAVKFTSKGFVNLHFSWTPAEPVGSIIHLDEDDLKHKLTEPSSALMALEKRKYFELRQINSRRKTSLESPELEAPMSLNDGLAANQSDQSLDGISPMLKQRPLSYKSMSMINELPKKAFSIPFTTRRVSSTFVHEPLPDDEISLELSEQEGYLKIECLDSGCGIAEELQSQLFKEFVRGDWSITRRFGGTGLGLYITNELVNRMDGWITVDSEVGTGTRICVVIPAKKIPSMASGFQDASLAQLPPAMSNASNILVVDDSSYNVDILIKFFNKLGLKSIYTASNGKEAVELFESKGKGFFSMITMDLQMPEMDGFAACRKIREVEARRHEPQTPIIIISGNCSKEEQDQCLSEQGGIRALAFYRKPVSFMDVEALVRKTIAQSNPKSASPVVSFRRSFSENKKKTLLVDGDEFTIDLLETLLRRYDWELDTTSDFQEALQAIKSSSAIEYVVIDCDKLEARSEELLQVFRELRRETNEVHEEELCVDVSIIALTSRDNSVQDLKGLGFDKVLKKPIRLNNLREIFCIEAIDFTSALNA